MTATAPCPSTACPTGRGRVFRYESFRLEPGSGVLVCRYSLDGRHFVERVTFPPPAAPVASAVAAARLVFLLAGVSYYKTAAPAVIDLGDVPVSDTERTFLREFYLDGLAEFGYRNGIDLSDLRIEGGRVDNRRSGSRRNDGRGSDAGPIGDDGRGGRVSDADADTPRPLIPFGGGLDSIVTVEMLRDHVDAALLVVHRPGEVFAAIERAAAVTGLPVLHVAREIDPQLMRSHEFGFLNGHVPVTGILSAIAVLAAALTRRDAVVMSNEWSASAATLVDRGRPVNHQYSKSIAFEAGFRAVLADLAAGLPDDAMPDYFSALRHRTELWIARQFAGYGRYHRVFHSCNRAFHIDAARRLDHWCGQCDKCCFIDLILAPFLSAAELVAIFDGHEPFADVSLDGRFRALLGIPADGGSADDKPFECVGEVGECRTAAVLAAHRPDRDDCRLLRDLSAAVESLPDQLAVADLLRPVGEHFVPARYATGDLVG